MWEMICMMLNSLENNDNKDCEEINNIFNLIMIKYKNMFVVKKACYIARLLYSNGIRSYMFFEENFDIDEIVYYLLMRDKIKKFPDVRVFSFDGRELDVCDNDCVVINILDYVKVSNNKIKVKSKKNIRE